jgi:ABC-type lipoprotein release transport system permease subunit
VAWHSGEHNDDLAGECATFLLTGLVAAFVPSLKASRVEPPKALRHE